MECLISGRCRATPKMMVDTLSRIFIVLNQLQCVRMHVLSSPSMKIVSEKVAIEGNSKSSSKFSYL